MLGLVGDFNFSTAQGGRLGNLGSMYVRVQRIVRLFSNVDASEFYGIFKSNGLYNVRGYVSVV